MMNEPLFNGAFTLIRVIPVARIFQKLLQEAAHALRQENAVIDAQVDKRGSLRAAYDTSRIGMHDIEFLLDGLDTPRDTAFWSRVKLTWFRLTDDNARDNAHAGSGACCSGPPVVPHNLVSRK